MSPRTLLPLALLLAGLAATTGCGESTCQRAQRINRDLFLKASSGSCTSQNEPFIERDCEEIVRACTDEDLQHLDDAMSCFEQVQCEPFKEEEFESNLNGCKPPLSGLSEACALAAPDPNI